MFDSSPGGNIGFEPDMKLTEKVGVMGGKMDAAPFKWFCDLCIEAFLAVRPYQDVASTLISLMLDTELHCFRGQTINLLKQRFVSNKNSKAAAAHMLAIVRNSSQNFRTGFYDTIQSKFSHSRCLDFVVCVVFALYSSIIKSRFQRERRHNT
jgi:phosphatidylinositol 4-kinase